MQNKILYEEHLQYVFNRLSASGVLNHELWSETKKLLTQIKVYDNALYFHCIHTSYLVDTVSKILNPPKYSDELMLAAILHDAGKLYISKLILDKDGPLNSNERECINLHSYFSYRILKSAGFPESVCQIALFHHGTEKERMGIIPDPSEEIVYVADILRACDIYEALTAERCYHKAASPMRAIEILGTEKLPSDIFFSIKEVSPQMI